MTVELAGWIVAALMLLYSVYQGHRAKEAEKELAAIKLRGDAPYLVPSDTFTGMIYEAADGGGIIPWNTSNGNVLYAQRHEISGSLDEGETVILLLDNSGEAARNIQLETELRNCRLCEEPEMGSAQGLVFLKYDFEPDKKGARQTVRMSFESPSGFKGEHIYETIHGQFHFKRIVPE